MKNIKIILLTAISSLALFSCVKDDEEDFGSGPRVVGFNKTQDSFIYTESDMDPVQVFAYVDLIGGSNGTPADNDITVTFELDASSTAIPNTEYTIDAVNNQVTIPAGSSFARLPITVNPMNLPGNTPKTIVLNLTETNLQSSTISEERKQITLTIAKCASDLAGVYSLVVTRIDNGTVYNFTTETITSTGNIGEYVTSSTAYFGDMTLGALDDLTIDGAPRNGFIFNDVCQSIVIPEQYLGDYFSNLVYGNEGETNEVTLDALGNVTSITMNYTVTFGAGPRKYRAVYTKL